MGGQVVLRLFPGIGVDPDDPFAVGNGIDDPHREQGQEGIQLGPQVSQVGGLNLDDALLRINIGDIALHRDLMMVRIGIFIALQNGMQSLFHLHADSVPFPFFKYNDPVPGPGKALQLVRICQGREFDFLFPSCHTTIVFKKSLYIISVLFSL